MPTITLEDKFDEMKDNIKDLTIKLECHLTEFKIFKKIGYAILAGILGILGKLYWQFIISSPAIVANVVAALNNGTM